MKFPYKLQPFAHQIEGSRLMIENKYFALFDEMGTGKSKTVIDAVNQMFCSGILDLVVLICPNQVKSQWANPEWGQIVTHTPEQHIPVAIYRIDAAKSDKQWLIYDQGTDKKLLWVVVNYEAVRLQRIASFLERIIKQHKTAMVLDESIYIKNHNAQQTKACLRLGGYADRRYILNGTPLTKGPLDYYAQFKFLHEKIIGIDRYIIFRNRYALMGGHMVKGRFVQVVGYQNLDELIKKIRPFYRRVTKYECLDLPKKLYQVVEVEMSDDQDIAYKSMKEDLVAIVEGKQISASIILTKLLRLSQISSGFISDNSTGNKITTFFKSSPKLDLAVEMAEDSDKPVVIFCLFRDEIKIITKKLQEKEISYGEIHGDVKLHDREAAIEAFQKGNLHVMVCQVATGGLGIELFAAALVIRVTNPYSHALQCQAEDRIHRSGIQHNVTYVDILSIRRNGGRTIDHMIYQTLKRKQDVVAGVLNMGDLNGKI